MENTISTVQQNVAPQNPAQLKPNFGLIKTILLSLITFGIYGVYVYAKVGSTLDFVAGRHPISLLRRKREALRGFHKTERLIQHLNKTREVINRPLLFVLTKHRVMW